MSVPEDRKPPVLPLHDWVLVSMDPLPTMKGSLVLPPDASVTPVRTGTVLAVGKGKVCKNGRRTPVDVYLGEKVAFLRWHLEHQSGKATTSFLEGLEEGLGFIRVPDILFAYDARVPVEVN